MQKSKTLSLTHQGISEDSAKDIKKAAKGAGISFIGSATGRGLSILCQIIIARFFGTEAFGLYTLGLVVLRITELVARFGLHTGAMRFVSMYRKENHGKVKGVLISASLISFVNGILLAVIIYFSAGFISESIFHKPGLKDVIITFVPGIPFITTMFVIATASQGFHTIKYSVYIQYFIQPIANIVLMISFVLLGLDIIWIINAFVISHTIACFLGLYFLFRQFPKMIQKAIKPIYEIKKLIYYSLPLLLTGFLGFLLLWTDTIMLGCMKTSKEVGIYRAASQIPIILAMILTASSSIYAPTVAEMYHLGQKERLEHIFKVTTRWVFYLALPLTFILIFSAREIMAIFGSDYVETGAYVLIWLSIAQFINCVTGCVGFTLSMTGKQNIAMINSIVMVVVNIILNYFLIPIYGSLGAAIATAISVIAINLTGLIEVYIIYKIHPYNKGYLQGCICGIIVILIFIFFNKYLPESYYIVRFITNSFIISTVFILSFLITGFSEEDRIIFDTIIKKFKIKAYS